MKYQDVSYWSDQPNKDPQKIIDDAKREMENFNIDIDDDIYWFTYFGLSNLTSNSSKGAGLLENLPSLINYSVRLWEIYRIHRSMNITNLTFANFTRSAPQLITVEGDKWQRRRDLKVNLHINVCTQYRHDVNTSMKARD